VMGHLFMDELFMDGGGPTHLGIWVDK
jgi:hypothetical protein